MKQAIDKNYSAVTSEEAVAFASRVNRELAEAVGLPASADALIDRLDALVALALPEPAPVMAADIPALAAEAASQWTGTFNPREMSVADYEALFSAVTR